jgi:hypothetical protein
MKKPRLIYYNDAHHFHAKRVEPKASIHMLQWPVDEVAGTGADTLVLGLGYSDVYFHQSKVGRVVGQGKQDRSAAASSRRNRAPRSASPRKVAMSGPLISPMRTCRRPSWAWPRRSCATTRPTA